MKFCHHCAGPLSHHVPPGDDKLRFCCVSCDVVFYQNPNNIVGTLPIYEDKVLLCRRAIEPRYGKWTLPAGFMENGETTLQGAVRETLEEAGARISLDSSPLYTLFNLPYINQVYFFFRGHLSDLDFAPGPESLETRCFNREDIPWNELAFPVVRKTLECYFEDREKGNFPIRMFDVTYSPESDVKKLNIILVSSSP